MLVIRPVLSLVLAVWFLQLSGGILSVVTPVGLSELGVTTDGIGLIAALYAAGFMAGAFYAPRMIGLLGNIRVFAAAAALTAVGAIAQGLFMSEFGWAFIRFVQGATFAAMFAAAEAWLGRATPKEHRGGVLGVYNVAAKAALLSGPLIVLTLPPLDPRNYLWCGLFLAAALVPVCITRQEEPKRIETKRLALMPLLKSAPSACAGVFIAGLVNTGTLALLPIYASKLSEETNALATAAIAYSIANLGGLISQWPAGRLSDRLDRRYVIAAMAFFAGVSALLLTLLAEHLSFMSMLGLLFVWGAGSLSFYSICVAHGVDRVEDDKITAMMSLLLIVWACGSVLGPIIAGFAMQTALGPSGLFAFAGAGLFSLVLMMLFRRLEKAPVAEEDQSDWQPAHPAGLPGGDLDPRTD